jgi:hypothetical protein
MRPSVAITDLAPFSFRKARIFSPMAESLRTSLSLENQRSDPADSDSTKEAPHGKCGEGSVGPIWRIWYIRCLSRDEQGWAGGIDVAAMTLRPRRLNGGT